jgi:uncharacterized protein YgiM (DUF1202 family)
MNPVRHIPMLPKPRKLRFMPRSSLHSIPAIRSLAWRRGAGEMTQSDVYDPATQGTDPQYDPNVEAGTGTKSAYDGGGSSSGGGALPLPNASVNNATQVSVTPASGANLRDQPSINGNVIAGENQGTILQVIGPTVESNGWIHVQDPQGRIGWIYSAYLANASQGQGTVSSPTSPSYSPAPLSGTSSMSSTPLGAGGIVGLLVVGGLVTGAYYLLVK